MGHFVLDPLWKHGIHFLKEHSVIVVVERRQPKEVDEESCCLMVVFHDECLEFRFGVRQRGHKG